MPKGNKTIDYYKPPKVLEKNDKPYRISFYTLITIAIIFLGSLGIAGTFALTTITRRQINLARKETQEQKETNTSLRAEMTQRYTRDEIAREAAARLGMNVPDDSQIIHIEVPKQGFVVLNPGIEEEEEINYFWQGIIQFFKR